MHDPLHFLRERTPSGVRVYCQHRPDLPWIAIRVIAMGGERHDPPDRPGTAHLLEHLVSMGNEGYPRKDPQELYRWAVEQGFQMIWGVTQEEGTWYGGRTALRNAEALARYLHALTILPELRSDLVHESEIVRDERTESGTLRIRDAQRIRSKAMFGDHPLCRTGIWPEDDVLYATSYDDLREFHARHYVCPNMAIVVSGGMEEDEVLYMLDRVFKDRPDAGRPPPPQPPPAFGNIPDPRRHLCRKEGGDIESIEMSYTWVAPRSAKPVDERLLVRTLRSLLSERVREKACAAYSVDVDLQRLRDCSIYTVGAVVPLDRSDIARKALEQALEDDDALAEEVPRERAEIMLQTELEDTTVGDILDIAVSRVLSDDGPEPMSEILDRYRELTADDVVGMRRSCMPLDKAFVLDIEE